MLSYIGISKKKLVEVSWSSLWIMSNCLPCCPHFLQIRDFHIAKREEDIGFYAGYVGEHNMSSMVLAYFVIHVSGHMTHLISWRILIYVGKSFDLCYLGNHSWSIWSKTCDYEWLNCTVSTHLVLFSINYCWLMKFKQLNVILIFIFLFPALLDVYFRIIFNTLFGLSTNFWMALSTRFLLGSLCGILGPMRVCILGFYQKSIWTDACFTGLAL